MFAGAQAGLRGEELRLGLFGRAELDAAMRPREELPPAVALFDDVSTGVVPSVFQLAPMTDGFMPPRGPKPLPSLTPFADLPHILPGLAQADMCEPALDGEQRVLPPESERVVSLPGDAWSEAVVEGPGLADAHAVWVAASLGGLEVPEDLPNIPAFYDLMHTTMQAELTGQRLVEPAADGKISFALRLQAAKGRLYAFAQAVAKANEGTVNSTVPNAWLLQNFADKLSELGLAADNFVSQASAEIPVSLHRALARFGVFFFRGELRAIDSIAKSEVDSLSFAEKAAWALRLTDYAQRAVNRAASEVLVLRESGHLSEADLAHVQKIVEQALERVRSHMPSSAEPNQQVLLQTLHSAAVGYLNSLNAQLIAMRRQFVRDPHRVDVLQTFLEPRENILVDGNFFALQFPPVAVGLDTGLFEWLGRPQGTRTVEAPYVVWVYPDSGTANFPLHHNGVLVRSFTSAPTIFSQLSWPPNPADVRLATVLAALGWSMSVQSVEGGVEVRVWNADQRLPELIERTPVPPPVTPEPTDSLSDDSQ